MFNSGNFDAKRLLDQFLTPQAGGQGGVPAQQGSLGGLLGGLTGGLTGSANAQPPGATSRPSGSGDVVGRAKEYLGNNGGSLASGAAAGALVSLVLGSKGGRKMAGNAVALGGLALVGTLAYKAYQNYQQGQQPQQTAAEPVPAQLPPAQSPFHPAQAERTHFDVTLLRTMIAASLADGHVDEAERAAISTKLGGQGAQLDDAERFLSQELGAPATPEALAGDAASPEQAAEIYMTALLAIDADTTSERVFLARLATALKLDPALVPHLEASARAARAG
ncbi:tellurite resistance TerB family protein [Ancylobacter dichloromethanicus]|nr:tellurite resistance TerB family protein [Ancylobacter dichloromethanicus]MBS7555350.1 tellurite resistance TerB family protein [Ancylobacter dichloromethanicus]